jgi:hypothetical protein
LVAYLTGPLWFALLMMAMVFLLLVVSVISFGFMIPWVVPVLGLLLGYALLVPVWVISVYTLSFLPLLLATFVGMCVYVCVCIILYIYIYIYIYILYYIIYVYIYIYIYII